jgi:hypothetical protein
MTEFVFRDNIPSRYVNRGVLPMGRPRINALPWVCRPLFEVATAIHTSSRDLLDLDRSPRMRRIE